MRDYAKELKDRVEFIRETLKSSGCTGVVYGNSGGKDSALVGILCKKATDNVLGVIMPCRASVISARTWRTDSRSLKNSI